MERVRKILLSSALHICCDTTCQVGAIKPLFYKLPLKLRGAAARGLEGCGTSSFSIYIVFNTEFFSGNESSVNEMSLVALRKSLDYSADTHSLNLYRFSSLNVDL